jgi:hypothetical protein
MGEECGTSATSPRTFVGIQHLFQHFFALGGPGLDNSTGLETDLDIVDQRALMRERLGGGHEALDAPGMRGGEHFLGRDIGIAEHAVLGNRGAAMPFVIVGEPDGEVGARAGKMQ